MPWVFLAAAIAAEPIGTLRLRSVANAPTWSAVSLPVAAYMVSILAMMASCGISMSEWCTPCGLWSVVGVTGVAVAGVLLYGYRLGGRAMVGIALIILGVVLLVTSGSTRQG